MLSTGESSHGQTLILDARQFCDDLRQLAVPLHESIVFDDASPLSLVAIHNQRIRFDRHGGNHIVHRRG